MPDGCHNWIEVTEIGDFEQRHVCSTCGAEKTEPFEHEAAERRWPHESPGERAYRRARERLDAHMGVGAELALRAIREDPMAHAVYQCAIRALAQVEAMSDGRFPLPIVRELDPSERTDLPRLSIDQLL